MTRYAYNPQTFRMERQCSQRFVRTEQSGTVTFTPQSGTKRQDDRYLYDLEANILEIRTRLSQCGVGGTNALDRVFTYDPLNRLRSGTGRLNPTANTSFPVTGDTSRSTNPTTTIGYTRNYVYDKVGNVELVNQQTSTGQVFNRVFNYPQTSGVKTTNRLNSFTVAGNTFAYTYDAAGNCLSETASRNFLWDAANRLIYVEDRAGTGNPSMCAQYLYDAAGNRVKKVLRKQGAVFSSRVYIDGVFEHLTEAAGQQNTVHLMDQRSRMATIRLGNALGDTTPAIKYELENNLNSSTVLLDVNGTVVNTQDTRVFYARWASNTKGTHAVHPFGETSFGSYGKKRYQYNGKERDVTERKENVRWTFLAKGRACREAALYYYGARYYHTTLCRFVSVDPIAEKYPQYTSYNYAGNKPITKRDLEGLQEEGAEPSPVHGETQLPDASPGVANFLLKEVEVLGTKSTSEQAYPINFLNFTGPLTQLGIEQGKKIIDIKADAKVANNIKNDIKADNYKRPVQTTKARNATELAMQGKPIHKDKGYYDAYRNQKVTTRGQGYETKEITSFRKTGKLAFEALGVVTDIYGLFDVVKNNSDPFTALPMIGPIAEINAERMRTENYENLQIAISLGYATTQRMLSQSSNIRNAIGEYQFLQLTDEELSHFVGLDESGYIKDEQMYDNGALNWKHAVLFQRQKEGWRIFALFMNASKN